MPPHAAAVAAACQLLLSAVLCWCPHAPVFVLRLADALSWNLYHSSDSIAVSPTAQHRCNSMQSLQVLHDRIWACSHNIPDTRPATYRPSLHPQNFGTPFPLPRKHPALHESWPQSGPTVPGVAAITAATWPHKLTRCCCCHGGDEVSEGHQARAPALLQVMGAHLHRNGTPASNLDTLTSCTRLMQRMCPTHRMHVGYMSNPLHACSMLTHMVDVTSVLG